MASAPPGPPDAPVTDLSGLSASVDRLTRHATDWSTRRLLDEGLDLVRDVSWADASALLRIRRDRVTVLHTRPIAIADPPDPCPDHAGDAELTPPIATPLPLDWFPWGLAPIRADRFMLVDDARNLPVSPHGDRTLGSLGIRSCLHLPLRQRGRAVGAVHVFWSEPRLAWDDDRGRLLRTLGRFLLSCADRDHV